MVGSCILYWSCFYFKICLCQRGIKVKSLSCLTVYCCLISYEKVNFIINNPYKYEPKIFLIHVLPYQLDKVTCLPTWCIHSSLRLFLWDRFHYYTDRYFSIKCFSLCFYLTSVIHNATRERNLCSPAFTCFIHFLVAFISVTESWNS